MKPLSECHVHVHDAGTFLLLADMFGKAAKRVTYYSPMDQEYLGLERCCVGDGFKSFRRQDEYMDPEFFNSVDLWCFPDIGYGGFQRYLRSIGKLVWGSMGASDLELYRTRFLDVVKKVGLPVVNSVRIKGVTALSEHLKNVKNKWVKINRYRNNMETWKHRDYAHSVRELERLAYVFGPFKEYVTFIVQDEIKGDEDEPVLEVGFDGWAVTTDGVCQFPSATYQGYEQKNQLYLGSLLEAKELPEEIAAVNEAFAPELARYGYRNFWATEIRIKGGVPWFIDPTARMAGQTMEHLTNTCKNLPQVIYEGAHGKMIAPEFSSPYAAEATIHYKGCNEGAAWKTFNLPEEVEPYVKLYQCAKVDGIYHFPEHREHGNDELGVVTGEGDSIEESVENLKDNFAALEDEPVSIELAGFADLIKQIEDATDEGVKFTDQELPSPEIALDRG